MGAFSSAPRTNIRQPAEPILSPALHTGMIFSDPWTRNLTTEQIEAKLPRFKTWQEAIAFEGFKGLSDEEKTNYLQSVYGLNRDTKVQGDQIVHAVGWVHRNIGTIALVAMLGSAGVEALMANAGTVAPAAGASALGPSTAANIAATTVAANAVPPALAASVGGVVAPAAGSAIVKTILQHVLPTAGKIVDGIIQNNAANKANKTEQDYLNRALDQAKDDEAYRRKTTEEQRAYDRQQTADQQGRFAAYTQKLDPYLQRGNAAGSRLEQLLTGSSYQGRANQPLAGSTQAVRMVAPDGITMADVQPQDVQRAEQAGARRV